MKLALILATLCLAAPLAHAKDISPNDVGAWHAFPAAIGWVDTAKLQAASTEIARVNARIAAARTAEQSQQISVQGNKEIATHLREACAKVKADKKLQIVVSDPLAADPKAEVTADVLKLWNAADEAGVVQENARLTARVAQLEAAALTKPAAPSIPPPPPTQPQPLASKGKK